MSRKVRMRGKKGREGYRGRNERTEGRKDHAWKLEEKKRGKRREGGYIGEGVKGRRKGVWYRACITLLAAAMLYSYTP